LKDQQELKRNSASFASPTDRAFLKQVSKEKRASPGVGTYIDDTATAHLQNPKTTEQEQKDKDHHLKNNPFGKADPRFDY